MVFEGRQGVNDLGGVVDISCLGVSNVHRFYCAAHFQLYRKSRATGFRGRSLERLPFQYFCEVFGLWLHDLGAKAPMGDHRYAAVPADHVQLLFHEPTRPYV